MSRSRRFNPDQEMVQKYRDWHWGIDPSHVVEWNDPDYPDRMVEIGRLLEMHHCPVGTRVPAGKEKHAKGRQAINVPRKQVLSAYLAFDPDSKHQRIYVLAPAPLRRAWKREFWNPRGRRWDLATLARAAGGRQQGGYPPVEVQPIGLATHVAYLTDKKGDDISAYIHAFGEETGVRGIWGIDSHGRIWLAGGNYHCPDPGITD